MQNLSLDVIKDATMTEVYTTTLIPEQLDKDMIFNDGHRLKIIVYRYAHNQEFPTSFYLIKIS